jgi:RNA polymerase subunit RPABC4/transcription elongation factor Spt4
MALEAAAATLVLALVLWLVFGPVLERRGHASGMLPPEPPDPEETRRGAALLALKEIEFDRATGKLNDADYELLKARYSVEAVAALKEEEGAIATATDGPEAMIAARVAALRSAGASEASVSCARCGLRPEADARYCSACGLPVGNPVACRSCGSALPAGSRFCPGCGARAAA